MHLRQRVAPAPLFSRIDMLNEQLVSGHEDVFFGCEFSKQGGRLPADTVKYHVQLLSNPDSLRGSFAWYRALATTIAQDAERTTRRLSMPVLPIGAERSFGDLVGQAVSAVADNVQSVVIPGSGHFVAEEAPEAMLDALQAVPASVPRRHHCAHSCTHRPQAG